MFNLTANLAGVVLSFCAEVASVIVGYRCAGHGLAHFLLNPLLDFLDSLNGLTRNERLSLERAEPFLYEDVADYGHHNAHNQRCEPAGRVVSQSRGDEPYIQPRGSRHERDQQ